MSIKIKELPELERPYEKLERYGEKYLSNAELLAIIIKSGTKEETSVQIAQKILSMNKDYQISELELLRDVSLEELMNIKGIGRVKAIQIKAVCELSIRMSSPSYSKKTKISDTNIAAKFAIEELRFEKREHIKLMLLNNKNELLKYMELSIGGYSFATINVQDVIAEALKIQAPRILLIHNHPSGDSTPSKKDFEVTNEIIKATKMFNITLLDHIVIGANGYTSIIEKMMENVYEDRRGLS